MDSLNVIQAKLVETVSNIYEREIKDLRTTIAMISHQSTKDIKVLEKAIELVCKAHGAGSPQYWINTATYILLGEEDYGHQY